MDVDSDADSDYSENVAPKKVRSQISMYKLHCGIKCNTLIVFLLYVYRDCTRV